ncbi:MAG: EVE domain-containing protein [Candidatus Riflebacteria bacterium]|nr:EVE domain-containing protein [Candidatus Riflebacteria bacterium]
MNSWILALPRADMEHCIKIGVFGRNRKTMIGHVKAGDNIVCYVTKECKIIAIGETASDYYMDDSQIFKSTEAVFPDRFKFKAKILPSNKQVDLKTLVDDLEFIGSKLFWSVYLRAGMNRLTSKDWKLIQNRLEK